MTPGTVAREREIEVKLEADAAAALPPLAAVPGVASVDPPRELRLEATYLDTEDGALAAAGIVLRRRTGGDDAGWHVKIAVDAQHREELQLPLGDADPVPEALQDAVALAARGRELVPVARIATLRTVHRLRDAAGRELVEVADDRVTAEGLGAAAGTRDAWREWEAELVDGEPQQLDAVVASLRDAGGHAPAAAAKLTRLLPAMAPAAVPSVEVGPDSPAHALVGPRLQRLVASLRTLDPLVRADVEEAVHRMRVEVRRLRGLLATARPLLERERTEPLRAELGWLGRALGEARDLEVQRRRLAEQLASEPGELVIGPVAARIDAALAAERRDAHALVLEAMRSSRYLALMDALAALAEAPPWTPRAAGAVHDVLAPRIRRDLRRVRRRLARADEATGAEREARLHAARRAVKRVRYAAELAEPAYGEPAAMLAGAAHELQALLGDMQDAVVARAVLRRLAMPARLAGESAFTYGLLHGRAQAAADAAIARLEPVRARAERSRLRRWLR